MFTGIIEDVGRIAGITRAGQSRTFTIRSGVITSDLHPGDSVSINGCCLTVTSIHGDEFRVDAVEETIGKTTLGKFATNQRVNLERALQVGGRLGGHFVQGHVDCMSKVLRLESREMSTIIDLAIPVEFSGNIVPVGSIAVDGVSLTVARRTGRSCTVSIIPHTMKTTILTTYAVGTEINLEFDILGKYVLESVKARTEGESSLGDTLRELGY